MERPLNSTTPGLSANLPLPRIKEESPVIQDLTPISRSGDARFALISGFQFDFRRVTLYFNRRAKGL
jgi:hypothetical protein